MSGKGWEFSPDAQKCSKIISNMDFEKKNDPSMCTFLGVK